MNKARAFFACVLGAAAFATWANVLLFGALNRAAGLGLLVLAFILVLAAVVVWPKRLA